MQILPCPFCNSSDLSVTHLELSETDFVSCGLCGADGPVLETREKAIGCWNDVSRAVHASRELPMERTTPL